MSLYCFTSRVALVAMAVRIVWRYHKASARFCWLHEKALSDDDWTNTIFFSWERVRPFLRALSLSSWQFFLNDWWLQTHRMPCLRSSRIRGSQLGVSCRQASSLGFLSFRQSHYDVNRTSAQAAFFPWGACTWCSNLLYFHTRCYPSSRQARSIPQLSQDSRQH